MPSLLRADRLPLRPHDRSRSRYAVEGQASLFPGVAGRLLSGHVLLGRFPVEGKACEKAGARIRYSSAAVARWLGATSAEDQDKNGFDFLPFSRLIPERESCLLRRSSPDRRS